MEKEMSGSIYAIADRLRTPGIKIRDVVIAPEEITKRVRMSTQRMLRNGAMVGTWASKAKRLCLALNSHYSLGLVGMSHAQGLYTPTGLPDEATEQLCELLDVNMALELMNDVERSLPKYVEQHQSYTRRKHEDRKESLQAKARVYLPFMNEELADQAMRLCADARTQEQLDKAEALCRDLEMGNEIPIAFDSI
jgi:hypothetical protein